MSQLKALLFELSVPKNLVEEAKCHKNLCRVSYVPHGRQENKATAPYGIERRGHNTEGNVAKQADFVYIEGEESVTM